MFNFVTTRVLLSASVMLFVIVNVSSVFANPLYVISGDKKGREIWMSNCEACHGYGIADAPIPMNPDEWDFRIAKGKDVLYEHAINGFIGPDYSMMPARGGNNDLSDEEVKLAVDYMVFVASFYIKQLNFK